MRTALIVAGLVLAALHQDFWLWDDRRLVLDVVPAGLAYHAAYSVVAAAFWALAMRFAWPRTVMDGVAIDDAGIGYADESALERAATAGPFKGVAK